MFMSKYYPNAVSKLIDELNQYSEAIVDPKKALSRRGSFEEQKTKINAFYDQPD